MLAGETAIPLLTIIDMPPAGQPARSLGQPIIAATLLKQQPVAAKDEALRQRRAMRATILVAKRQNPAFARDMRFHRADSCAR